MESGSLRRLSDCADGPPTLSADWGFLRAVQFRMNPVEVPEGHLLSHVVTLNLGTETICDARFSGENWQTHYTPYLGVGVIPALLPYEEKGLSSRDILAVELTPDFVTAALGDAGAKAELRPVIGARDAFAQHVLLALAEEARTRAPSGSLRAESLGVALATHLVEHDFGARCSPEPALPSQRLRRVLDYVATHLDAPLSVRTLASLVDMDVFRFIRSFKQSTGLSPHRYVLEARINRSKELLRDPRLSITDIALQTGFATPSHFSVTFRRLVNATPRDYRESVK